MFPIRHVLFGVAAAAMLSIAPAAAQEYTAAQLLDPCTEADNDARYGQYAETECEQYILGFVNALQMSGMAGASHGICLPTQNVADEIRWAFMRWVNEDYSRRHMSAANGLMGAIKAKFACGADGQAGGEAKQ